jgi:hypothetical protein
VPPSGTLNTANRPTPPLPPSHSYLSSPPPAQVSWLQEFCEHLVENSLSRSLLQQQAASERGGRKRESASAKRKRGKAAAAAAAADGGEEGEEGEEEGEVKPPKPKRNRSKIGAGPVGIAEPIGMADSAELIGAFKYHEGGPPTPLAEPLSFEVRAALGRGLAGAQISGILGRFDENSMTPLRGNGVYSRTDCVYSRMPISPAELSGLLSPGEILSPGAGMCFDVDELLKIVGTDRPGSAAEVLMSPRGQPLISLCLSPQTRGPLEALWGFEGPLSAQRTPGGAFASTTPRWPKPSMPPPPARPRACGTPDTCGGPAAALPSITPDTGGGGVAAYTGGAHHAPLPAALLADAAADAAASGAPSKQAGGSDGGSKEWKPPAALGLRISCGAPVPAMPARLVGGANPIPVGAPGAIPGGGPFAIPAGGFIPIQARGGAPAPSPTSGVTAPRRASGLAPAESGEAVNGASAESVNGVPMEAGPGSTGIASGDVAGWMNLDTFDSLLTPGLTPAPLSVSSPAPLSVSSRPPLDTFDTLLTPGGTPGPPSVSTPGLPSVSTPPPPSVSAPAPLPPPAALPGLNTAGGPRVGPALLPPSPLSRGAPRASSGWGPSALGGAVTGSGGAGGDTRGGGGGAGDTGGGGGMLEGPHWEVASPSLLAGGAPRPEVLPALACPAHAAASLGCSSR